MAREGGKTEESVARVFETDLMHVGFISRKVKASVGEEIFAIARQNKTLHGLQCQ
jgi:hypothetical protein